MEIIPHVYQITTRGCNIILIVEEELTLIDTGLHGSSPQIVGFIHSLGHTPGSISLFSPQKKLLIVGDALNSRYKNVRLPPKFVSTDLSQAIDSVKRIARLDFDVLCFGHGRPLIKDASARVHDLIKKQGL